MSIQIWTNHLDIIPLQEVSIGVTYFLHSPSFPLLGFHWKHACKSSRFNFRANATVSAMHSFFLSIEKEYIQRYINKLSFARNADGQGRHLLRIKERLLRSFLTFDVFYLFILNTKNCVDRQNRLRLYIFNRFKPIVSCAWLCQCIFLFKARLPSYERRTQLSIISKN